MMVKVVLFSLVACLLPTHVFSCTTIAVGKDASVDGSVFCSHSNDGEGDTDPRLVLIPASDWPASNATRPIFYSPESFPRYVGYDRASVPVPAYEPSPSGGDKDNGETTFTPICHIPQVRHTFQYLEETYGALNEKQLGIAESTCSGVFGAAPKGIEFPGYGVGKACFSIDTLSQIAMERHSRARDAISEMGALAEQMGFYGAGLFEGTSESLIVTDKEEAWVFHILPDPTGASAIWAAQRVPDDSFAVISNVFIIREIDVNDQENFLHSESVFTVAKNLGWWSEEDGKLDFTAVYSDGEYAHKYYSGRRSWGVFHLFAPSLDLPATYKEWRISNPYPFAAKPDQKLGLEDIAKAMRYFYEGTDYSQAGETSGLNIAGGPWKSPDHVSGGSSTTGIVGSWERTIGLYRSSDTYISQSRSWLPDSTGSTLWYGAYAAPYTVYVPFAPSMSSLPSVTLGHHMRLNKNTLFWANRYLGNYVQLKWTDMMKEVVAFQSSMHEANLVLQARIDQVFLASAQDDDTETAAESLLLYWKNAELILQRTWEFCDHLMFKYADGQIHPTPTEPTLYGTSTPRRSYTTMGVTIENAPVVDKPGYPNDWLEAVGYPNGPPPPPDCQALDWQCGHKPFEGETLHLRGDLSDNDNNNNNNKSNPMRIAWKEYWQAKDAAANAENAACHVKGDVAAAIGACRNEHVRKDDKQDQAIDALQA
jgi:dipeptidase